MLLCGGAYVRLQGGNIEMGMPGTFTVKAASHDFVGPDSLMSSLPSFLPVIGDFSHRFVATWQGTGIPAANVRYQILNAAGEAVMEGRTSDKGETQLSSSKMPDGLAIRLLGD